MRCRRGYSDAVIRKVMDADFESVMKSVNFKRTPREEVTVGDMERHYHKYMLENRESEVLGAL